MWKDKMYLHWRLQQPNQLAGHPISYANQDVVGFVGALLAPVQSALPGPFLLDVISSHSTLGLYHGMELRPKCRIQHLALLNVMLSDEAH